MNVEYRQYFFDLRGRILSGQKHPDVTTIVWKWGRWQHQVDYSSFKRNKLIPKKSSLQNSDGDVKVEHI